MDYDATNIPAAYDCGRALDDATMAHWMSVLASYADEEKVETILDLGCGTGRFSAALAMDFNASVIAVDPSEKMLEQARAKREFEGIEYRLGTGEAIPLGNDEVDMVFISMVYHHFHNPPRVAREVRRVLQDGGNLFVRTGTREQISSYAYVPFFPGSIPLLNDRLPSRTEVRNTFESAGFKSIVEEAVPQQIAPDWGAYSERLAAGADSILVSLDPEAFRRGIEAVRARAATVDAGPVTEVIDLLVFR